MIAAYFGSLIEQPTICALLTIGCFIVLIRLAVSFALYLVARLSPYEWRNPHPCKKSHNELENQFTLFNSLWFLICNIMQQGSNWSRCYVLQ
jgi:glutamate receptor, ionotropic, invertebrate